MDQFVQEVGREIGARLKDERQRIGLSQEATGDFLGVTRRTVLCWEAGNPPIRTDMLIGLARHGFDAVYVMTGVRVDESGPGNGKQGSGDALSTQDTRASYRILSPAEQLAKEIESMELNGRDAELVLHLARHLVKR
jgi:transcriptional regulator with XRE-family HTH domain